MPSDNPPPRPSILIRRTPAGTTAAGQPAAQPGLAPDGNAKTVLIRRFWHREPGAGDLEGLATPEGTRRGVSNSTAWVAIVVMSLISAVLIRQGPGLMEPPPRVLAPVVGNVARVPEAEPLPEPDIVNGYGTGAISQGNATVHRAGRAGEDAIRCGLRTRAWVNDAREALVADITDRFPAFEETTNLAPRMRNYLSRRFQYSQRLAADDFDERGRQSVCDNLPYSPDLGLLAQAAQQAGLPAR